MTLPENGAIAAGEAPNGALGLANGASYYYREIDSAQRKAVHAAGQRFAGLAGGHPCLLLIGKLLGLGDLGESTERRIQLACEQRFGFPKAQPEETINVILDSTGGPLDSAFRTVLFLSRYAETLNIYVPRKAKSASTLIAVGASKIFMSPFGELGPLDTQIRDPRNPTDYISALDCYQSVDYVREFGFSTLSQALKQLAAVTQGKLLLTDSLDAAAQFAIGSITPMLSQTRSLDFGAWGRSLKMGEKYAQILLSRAAQVDQLKADKIAYRLVYGYTHHLFPIDITEARDIGLNPEEMTKEQYESAIEVVSICNDNQVCIEFVNGHEQPGARDGSSQAGTVPESAAPAGAQETVSEPLSSSS
jgi:Serine dehydrogenase proteinase